MPSLNIANVIEHTEAEGPGARFAVWVQGCPMRCKGCCNPELLAFRPATAMDPGALAARALASGDKGVSLLGGEPFAQAEALADLAERVRAGGLSVMVYTGYTMEELRASSDPHVARLLATCDLLVDGRYEASRRTLTRRWVGSDNQRMHFLTDRYQPDMPAFHEANTIEIRLTDGEITLNGWPLDGARTGRDLLRTLLEPSTPTATPPTP